jgi:hypothetical protein
MAEVTKLKFLDCGSDCLRVNILAEDAEDRNKDRVLWIDGRKPVAPLSST